MVGVTFTDMTVIVNSASLFLPPGDQDVYQWTHTVARQLETRAKMFCPPIRQNLRLGLYEGREGTGALRDSISTFVYNYGDVHVISIDLSANTPYALFVHEGTAYQGQRYIYSHAGFANKALIDAAYRVSPGSAGGKGINGLRMGPLPKMRSFSAYHGRVHGQKANPFLTDAYSAVRRMYHPALPAKRFAHTFTS